MKLKQKIALVTGGRQGIGKAITDLFRKEGAEVITFDRTPESGGLRVDIRQEEEIRRAMSSISKLDILINNAGIYVTASVGDMSKEDLDAVIDTNLKGTFLVTKYALPLLNESKGNVINVSSGLGLVPEPASPAYCATKAGINMLTKCLAQEYAAHGVRVNAVLPGPIDTPLLRTAFPSEDELNEYAKLNPMRRIGTPDEVAKLCLFLASDDAAYITGALFPIDGGESSSSVYSK